MPQPTNLKTQSATDYLLSVSSFRISLILLCTDQQDSLPQDSSHPILAKDKLSTCKDSYPEYIWRRVTSIGKSLLLRIMYTKRLVDSFRSYEGREEWFGVAGEKNLSHWGCDTNTSTLALNFPSTPYYPTQPKSYPISRLKKFCPKSSNSLRWQRP